MDKFFNEIVSTGNDNINHMKDMFETLLASNKRVLSLKYIKKVEECKHLWTNEAKVFFLAKVCSKLGLMCKAEHKYSEGLFYFEMGLDYFKRIEVVPLPNTADELLRKKNFGDTLLNIALCCYEEKEYDRAAFFNKKVGSHNLGGGVMSHQYGVDVRVLLAVR